jgi:heterotetrameric sarcosine oxidase delta subunit
MLQITCPFCGDRGETEFIYGGPVGSDRPDPADVTDAEWLDHLLMVPNPTGPVEERWWHARGCGDWFTIWRHTVTHDIVAGPAND